MITEQHLFETAAKMNLPKPFKIDSDNKAIITKVLAYFNRQEGELDLKKGLLLHGAIGCGKTILMKVIQKYYYDIEHRRIYGILTCDFLVSRFKKEEDALYDIYAHINKKSPLYTAYCFDDLGTEDEVNIYGTKTNVMVEILKRRYEVIGYAQYTHITTNLGANELRDKYGNRLTDRFKELFNIVAYPTSAKSRR